MTDNVPDWILQSRSRWTNTGKIRPGFAVEPKPGQESVWDYPRPPIIVKDSRVVTVHAGDHEIARTTRAVRVLETAGPPTFYLPAADIRLGVFEEYGGGSMCEWKGKAAYWSVSIDGLSVENAAWSYPSPFPEFIRIRDHYSFYPAKLVCHVGSELVSPQAGGFYGGWVTSEVVGPMKGDPGSESW